MTMLVPQDKKWEDLYDWIWFPERPKDGKIPTTPIPNRRKGKNDFSLEI